MVDDGCSGGNLAIRALCDCHGVSVDGEGGCDCVAGLYIEEVDLLGCWVSDCYWVAVNGDACNVVANVWCD